MNAVIASLMCQQAQAHAHAHAQAHAQPSPKLTEGAHTDGAPAPPLPAPVPAVPQQLQQHQQHQQPDVTTLLVRHVLMTAVNEFGREDMINHIIDRMFIPLGKRLLPIVVTVSVMAVFMLLATLATLVMALSCFLRLRAGGARP